MSSFKLQRLCVEEGGVRRAPAYSLLSSMKCNPSTLERLVCLCVCVRVHVCVCVCVCTAFVYSHSGGPECLKPILHGWYITFIKLCGEKRHGSELLFFFIFSHSLSLCCGKQSKQIASVSHISCFSCISFGLLKK